MSQNVLIQSDCRILKSAIAPEKLMNQNECWRAKFQKM